MSENKVKELRAKLGIGQSQLAEELNVSRQTISNYENDRCETPEAVIVYLKSKLQKKEEIIHLPNTVPELPINAIGGEDFWADNVGVMAYDCEQVISPIPQAELAIRVSGDSMYPRYPNGCRVFVKKVNESVFIEWGSYYVLATDNGVVIKRVYLLDDETIECRSVNPDYQPFKVKLESVHGWYKVLGSLHLE